tara:strand:- start:11291 stop:12127 length:837 start_codon:yes stop_codon:yes gene_type:complete
MAEKLLLNGYHCNSDLFQDRAFHYGDGVFETIAVLDGVPCLWDYHLSRLTMGCEILGLDKFDSKALLDEALELIKGQSKAVLKIVLSSGDGDIGYSRPPNIRTNRYLKRYPWPEQDIYNNQEDLRTQICSLRLSRQPALAGIKHLNRLEQVLARRELKDGINEGLMCDTEGLIIEGTCSNIFIEKNKKFYTPRLSDCGVAGVVRQYFIDFLNKNNFDLSICDIDVKQIFDSDSLFLTNSLLGIRKIKSINEHICKLSPESKHLIREAQKNCFTLTGCF